jgi:AcrR family transcriptional regulator
MRVRVHDSASCITLRCITKLSPPPATPLGRPRDDRIDDAVRRATLDLLESGGYLELSITAIAERAGTTKPAIYRRWPTKAHLVHDAVFPAQELQAVPAGGDLRADIRALVSIGLELLGRPAARAALPGLLAETAADPALGADVLGRAAGGTWAWLQDRLEAGVADGEVRADVKASTMFELVAGAAFIATATRAGGAVDDAWIDEVVDLIMRGITP